MSTALTFIAPPPGFAPLVDFTLHGIDGANGLYSLQSDADESIRLFVLDAGLYLPDYSPEISEEQGADLELVRGEDALVLVVANPGEAGITVNLMAPIVVNSATHRCAQVILDGRDWPIQAALAPAA